MTDPKPEEMWAAYNSWGRRVFGPFKRREELISRMARYRYSPAEQAYFSVRRVTITPDPESENDHE